MSETEVLPFKYYKYPHRFNVGDVIPPHILSHFRPDLVLKKTNARACGKLLLVGSVMGAVMPADTVLGAGVLRETDTLRFAPWCKFLSVRGALSRERVIACGGTCPRVYGDPALLLPLMYTPTVPVTHEVGIVPHFVDKHLVHEGLAKGGSWKLVDVFLPWQEFVRELLSCERIVSSSLHGLVIAEAYGLPVEWAVLSDKVIGNGFKFRDYLTGTGRKPQDPGVFPPLRTSVLAELQSNLTEALHYLSVTPDTYVRRMIKASGWVRPNKEGTQNLG